MRPPLDYKLRAPLGTSENADSIRSQFALGSPLIPEDWRDSLDAWRIGLDRWLRRTTRVRLSDVIARPGWLTSSDGALDVRFGVDQADIRLRRRALDLDPGWVDWLGLVVRYRFRDAP